MEAGYHVSMADQLNPHEARVLGVLVEKAFTTPDAYPLSLNGATTASNQKSNRDPVVFFTEPEVRVALQGLVAKHFAGGHTPAGSRVEKWRHNAREHLGLDDAQLAVLTEMLLRGPQSASALKTRASRMVTIASPDALDQVLAKLVEKGLARLLPAGAGSRVERWEQCLAPSLQVEGEGASPSSAHPAEPALSAPSQPLSFAGPARSSADGLEQRVAALETQVAELKRQFDELMS